MRLVFWIKRETLHLLPVFLFFFIGFTIINGTEKYLFEKAGLTPYSFFEILVAAAVIAKIFLVMDHLPWASWCGKIPLFYRILLKTAFYLFVTMCVRITMRFLPFFLSGEGLKNDFASFISRENWRLFFSIQGYYVMLLFIFTTARDLTEALGAEKMKKLFFGR